MYHVVCHSCGEDDVFPDREPAQAAFTRHVDEQHEVVLRRVDTPREASGPCRDGPSPSPGPRDGESGAAGNGTVD